MPDLEAEQLEDEQFYAEIEDAAQVVRATEQFREVMPPQLGDNGVQKLLSEGTTLCELNLHDDTLSEQALIHAMRCPQLRHFTLDPLPEVDVSVRKRIIELGFADSMTKDPGELVFAM